MKLQTSVKNSFLRLKCKFSHEVTPGIVYNFDSERFILVEIFYPDMFQLDTIRKVIKVAKLSHVHNKTSVSHKLIQKAFNNVSGS